MSTYCTKSAINVSPKTMIGQQSARHHGPTGSDSRNDSNGMGAGGSQFVAIDFEGLQATPDVDVSRCQAKETGRCGARMAYSLKATGVRSPSHRHRAAVSSRKDAVQKATATGLLGA